MNNSLQTHNQSDSQFSVGFYQNTQALAALKSSKPMSNHEALKKVASQFESLFLQTMLKNARQTTEIFNEDNPFSSRETKFYQEMLDNQLSVELSSTKSGHPGFGIAELIVRQLSQSTNISEKSEKGDG